MNWEAISTVSEVIGAVAVVVSLIYLAAQIRQNTKLMRATAKHSLTEASQNVLFNVAQYPEVWVKFRSGEKPSSVEEDARMSLMVRAILRGFESQCYQQEAGLLEEQEWQALRTAIVDICALPGVTPYWQQLKPHMSERLRQVVDGTTD